MIKKLLNTKISKENKKGFTLAELLIVVAIIGVLVAVSIPIFTAQLEKAREATDAANIRDAYAVIQAAALTEDDATTIAKNNTKTTTYTRTGDAGSYVYTATITPLKQTQDNWQSGVPDIGGIATVPEAKKGGKATITYTQSTGATTLTIE